METTDDENLINEISANNSYVKNINTNEKVPTQSNNHPFRPQCNSNENEENQLVTPSSNRKSLRTSDVRMHAGALTGVGPIRGIMKKSATDICLNANPNFSEDYSENELQQASNNAQNSLPKIQLNEDFNSKSYVTPNLRKKYACNVMQSDL
jgi:hypothetical protein